MPDETVATPAATTSTEAPASSTSVLSNADQPVISKDDSILDVAGQQDKAEKEADAQRLLKADPATLTPEDVAKRDGLVKADEEAKAKALEAEKAKGVPEKYDIKAPEGVTLNEARIAEATEIFKANGLTNKQAQEMVNLFVKQTAVAQKEAEDTFNAFKENSAKETMEALGANAKTELNFVAKVKNMFSPETVEILSASGMGNQKSFIMDLAKIGRLFSEERNVDTGKGSAGGKDIADVLYPNYNK